jgi:MFS family permease
MIEWWTNQQAGLIGGIGGSVIGILGAAIGTTMGIFAPRGRFKALVLGAMTIGVVLGLATLFAGIIAISTGQPYHVWYPLLLAGTLATVLDGALLPMARMRYKQAEQRKLDAAQIRQG